MDSGGAYGGGKAGAPFDPFTFVQRPQVILRAVCLLFAIIVFACISSQGWMYDETEKTEVCLFNRDASACHYGEGVAILAFLASIGFLGGEYLFEQMSSVKTRKHYVLLDLGYSGFWAFLYFISFCYLANQWSNAQVPPGHIGVGNVQAAICFSFFSVFTWAGCAWFAYQRFRQGADSAFAPTYEADPSSLPGAAYTSYPGGPDTDAGYQEAPFSGNQPRGNVDYQAPAY
ncbi:synaptogyrin isoform X1 [Lycorma delicatula]|uniref:synaptogyrin isoform X1 n=1 Tax=Lycorma delicatula TaxID=130591 RepID=UPI003F51A368